MKRSEMKSIIGNMHPFRTMDMYEAAPLIEDLLTEIEKEGMLPPPIEVKDKYFGSRFRYNWESESSTEKERI